MKEKIAFQKILNYLLFEDFNSLEFNSGEALLSDSYIKSNSSSASNDEALILKLNSILSSILLKLESDERSEIIEVFINDEISYNGFLFIFTMEAEKNYKDQSSQIPIVFLQVQNYYVTHNKLNDYLLTYVRLYFTSLFEIKFTDKSKITIQEYNSVLNLFTTKKYSME